MIIILYFITRDIFYILILTSLYNVFVKSCMFTYNFIAVCLVKRREQFKSGSSAISSKNIITIII